MGNNPQLIQDFESRLGCQLPIEYREFLTTHNGNDFKREITVSSETLCISVTRLLTIGDIIDNDENDCIGLPEIGLMLIGETSMTAWLYIKLTDDGFGDLYIGNFSKTEPANMSQNNLLSAARAAQQGDSSEPQTRPAGL